MRNSAWIKLVSIILLLSLTLSLPGCGSAAPVTEPSAAISAGVERTSADTAESVPENESAEKTDTDESENVSETQNSVLVVYFSATGTTRGVAERIAALTGADLAEIIPVQPYTAEDLNYSDRTTRASAEQNAADARPEIANEINLAGYATIFLGYPIWWGQAPRIMSTFVESHDFSGQTVIPFCTSGSSDIGQSDDNLAEQAGSGHWIQGRRFSGSTAEDTLTAWIEETGITSMQKTLRLIINDTEISVDWEDNESVEALIAGASSSPLTIQMSMYGGFEQVGALGMTLPRSDSQMTTQPGDIVLYSGNQIVVFYGSNSWSYTPLGRIAGKSASELAELLGNGDVTLTLAWS